MSPRMSAHLTPMQTEVFAHLATGMANKEIARALGMAVATVKVHASEVYRKLGLRNRTEAAALFARREPAP